MLCFFEEFFWGFDGEWKIKGHISNWQRFFFFIFCSNWCPLDVESECKEWEIRNLCNWREKFEAGNAGNSIYGLNSRHQTTETIWRWNAKIFEEYRKIDEKRLSESKRIHKYWKSSFRRMEKRCRVKKEADSNQIWLTVMLSALDGLDFVSFDAIFFMHLHIVQIFYDHWTLIHRMYLVSFEVSYFIRENELFHFISYPQRI